MSVSRGRGPSTPGRIYANIWASDNLMEWVGGFRYAGQPLSTAFDWIGHKPAGQD